MIPICEFSSSLIGTSDCMGTYLEFDGSCSCASTQTSPKQRSYSYFVASTFPLIWKSPNGVSKCDMWFSRTSDKTT